jgi:hypothetical protein
VTGSRRAGCRAGRHVRSLLLGSARSRSGDGFGKRLRGGGGQTPHPRGFDLLDAFRFSGSALAFMLGMPGQDLSFRWAQRSGALASVAATDRIVAYPSGVSLYTTTDTGNLIAPTMVAAFDGWVDAGSAATSALAHFGDEGTVVARFDADVLFDYRARRPPLEIVDGKLTELTWHELVVRRVRIADRDVLVLAGPEPDYRWRAFTSAIVELVRSLEVTEWVSLGAIPAAVPHTRPVPILGTEATKGLLRGDVSPGPAGVLRVPSALVSALELEVSEAGIPALGYFAQVPHYVSGPYATAAVELLRALGNHLGTVIPADELEEEARELRGRLDTATGLDETTRSYVERLEVLYDEQRLPSGGDLIADIERFLRDQGSQGQGSQGQRS